MDPATSLGTQELSQARGGALLMWQRTICSAPLLADFLLVLPSSSPRGAILKPRRSQGLQSKCHSISKRSTGNFTEVEKKHPTSRSGSFERSHLFGPVNYMVFGTMWRCPIHVYEPLSDPRKNPLPMLNTPVLTDCEKMDSTLRKELPKTLTF